MKDHLVTDFLKIDDYKKIKSKKYLEIPKFDKNFNFSKDIIFYKNWNNYKNKINDMNKNIKMYDYFLKQLIIFLNNYHGKNYSKRYWEITLGFWLHWFISSISFKWKLVDSLKNKNFIFFKKKVDTYDLIPHGIEDFTRISSSDYWNHYFFSRIIEDSFSKKISIISKGKILNNYERIKIYKNLKSQNIKEKLSLTIQTFLNIIPQNKKSLIFSTYMSNLQEMWLNLLINKSLLFYKSLRPNILFRENKIYNFQRKKFPNLKSRGSQLEKFLSKEILRNLPTTFLENHQYIDDLSKNIPFPKKPKKIFTCLGILRSTLMDRYIAKNVENGTTLILAQHGGNYFQHKSHFNSSFEVRIADKYLSWGNIKGKKILPFGVIKNLKKSSKVGDKIILEIRMRKGYNRDIKIDSGFFESQKYIKYLCDFFLLIKNDELIKKLLVKLHPVKSFWHEKDLFLSANPRIKFLDESKKMHMEIQSAKIVIQTFCSTGHLESLATNKPTLMYLTHDFNLLEKKSQKYFLEFKKIGIVHTNPKSLYNMLLKINNKGELTKWWYQKKVQRIVKKYISDYCILNKNKFNDLKKIINNV